MKFLNSKGNVYYGMHFYPGVAEYRDAGSEDAYRVFINEDTIRSMSPSFAGRPIFVEHVDEVDSEVDKLRNTADGWVIESFFNPADGKTWAKFIVVSEAGERAIANGFKLSNAYLPKAFGPGGLWNGVQYSKEVTVGEFEHLAIVRNPRYEESRILTPEQFKQYNSGKELELKKLANSKKEEIPSMKFNIFKKTKVENSAEIEGMSVTLPKSKKEVSIEKLINDADEAALAPAIEAPADAVVEGDPTMMKVKVGDVEMTVAELVTAYLAAKEPAAPAKKEEPAAPAIAAPKLNEEKKDEESDEDKKKKMNNFESLKNAHLNVVEEVAVVELSQDKLSRGKARYGSN